MVLQVKLYFHFFLFILIIETGLILANNYNPYDKRWKVMELPDIRKPFIRIETPQNAQNPDAGAFRTGCLIKYSVTLSV